MRYEYAPGWFEVDGANGAHGLAHAESGWHIFSVGGGVPHRDRFLLWSPRVFGPDDSCTCKYAKAAGDGTRCIVFNSLMDAVQYFEEAEARAPLIRGEPTRRWDGVPYSQQLA